MVVHLYFGLQCSHLNVKYEDLVAIWKRFMVVLSEVKQSQSVPSSQLCKMFRVECHPLGWLRVK